MKILVEKSNWTGGEISSGPVTNLTPQEYFARLQAEGTPEGGVTSRSNPLARRKRARNSLQFYASLDSCDAALRKLGLGRLITEHFNPIEETLFDKIESDRNLVVPDDLFDARYDLQLAQRVYAKAYLQEQE